MKAIVITIIIIIGLLCCINMLKSQPTQQPIEQPVVQSTIEQPKPDVIEEIIIIEEVEE